MYTDSLTNMYITNFSLMQYHNYSLTELENMIPFEREIYLQLLKQHIVQQNKEQKTKK